MKKLLVLSFIFTFLAIIPVVSAAEHQSTRSADRMASKAAERRVAELDKLSENLKERANKEIDRRVESLTKLDGKLIAMKRLSTEDKASLSAQIKSQVDDLNALRNKIAADTDVATLKADVKSIVTSYRIYLLFMPKLHILAAADVMAETADMLTEVSAKLKIRIADARTKGLDVTALEAALASMDANIADAKKQAQDAKDLCLSLKPEDYPANKAQLTQARAMIQAGRKDLQDARKDARTVVQGLKTLGLREATRSATRSASKSATKSPEPDDD